MSEGTVQLIGPRTKLADVLRNLGLVETTPHLPLAHIVLLVVGIAVVDPEAAVPPFLAYYTLHHVLLVFFIR